MTSVTDVTIIVLSVKGHMYRDFSTGGTPIDLENNRSIFLLKIPPPVTELVENPDVMTPFTNFYADKHILNLAWLLGCNRRDQQFVCFKFP